MLRPIDEGMRARKHYTHVRSLQKRGLAKRSTEVCVLCTIVLWYHSIYVSNVGWLLWLLWLAGSPKTPCPKLDWHSRSEPQVFGRIVYCELPGSPGPF